MSRNGFCQHRGPTPLPLVSVDLDSKREGATQIMSPPPGRAVRDAPPNRDGKITREVVLAAALELIDRDGAEGLSMRRLARALNRDPMVLYRHAPNKAALLDGVAEMLRSLAMSTRRR
jgi:AcrR family transcriptional regulator